jgi:signal transduction histidine kinase
MSVSTIEPAVLASIERNDFYSVLQQFPSMTKDIIAVLNKRLRNQNDRLISEFKGREEQLKELVRIRTQELEDKNLQLEKTLDELHRSQEQLVQSEKLASLGQLIAGIAHEIQNPLNFVNNFSQLSNELIKEAIETEDQEERMDILSDLEGNMSKIHQHGKRADSIVKNMLEHSRSGKGEKQKINIVPLCKEYVTLSFQGMRANNAGFNCTMDINSSSEDIQVNVVPQEISRVILNLVNNAFYALNERMSEDKNFNPVFKLSLSANGSLYIKISDNGKGIPEAVKNKIFEPFFTTKPTGKGTGLGLSLSFDIVKAHGGNLSFTSTENQGTEFTIELPLKD